MGHAGGTSLSRFSHRRRPTSADATTGAGTRQSLTVPEMSASARDQATYRSRRWRGVRTTRAERSGWRVGVAVFVLAATLLPLATMAYYVVRDVVNARERGNDAAQALTEANALADSTVAVSAYSREVFASYLLVGGTVFKLNPAVMSIIVGSDIPTALREARTQLDTTLGRLPADFPLHRLAAALVRLRPAIDAGTATPDQFGDATVRSGTDVRMALQGQFDRLRLQLSGSRGTARLEHAVDDVNLAVALVDAIASQHGALLALQGGVKAAAGVNQMSALVRRNDEFQRLADQVTRRAGPRLQARWQRFAGTETNRAVTSALADTEQRAVVGDITPVPLQQLGGLLRQVTERLDDAFGLIDEANAELIDAATSLDRSASADATYTLAIAALVSIAAVLAVIVVKRRIVEPLRALEGASTVVQAGELPEEQLAVAGPREVAIATEAFNGLIATLDTISQQAEALAGGALDAEVLDLPAPGRLGASIQGSVERLQDSITAQATLASQLAYDATHDRLTHLSNRSAATDALEGHLQAGRPVTVALVALDGFKAANDAFGHTVGDRALAGLAARLGARRDGDTMVARWGGDEFLIVSPARSDAEAAELGHAIMAEIGGPLDIGTATVRLGASVGVVPPSAELDSVGEILRAVNMATRRAKTAGRGMLQLFDATARADLDRIDALGVRLRDALSHDELTLHYQPLIDPTNGRLVEVEALIRWFPASGPPIAPGEFLPVAEATGLSGELDEWVVRHVATQLSEWRRSPALRNLNVALNLTAASALSHGIAERLLSWLWWADADPRQVVVEINEDTFVSSFASMGERLDALRAAGVLVSVDDFGTGLTSIGQLRAMPVDIVKLDRSLVVGSSATDRNVLRAVVDLGHALDLGIVAEGIETAEQAALCTKLGCHRLQGWLYAPALAPDDLADWAAHNGANRRHEAATSPFAS